MEKFIDKSKGMPFTGCNGDHLYNILNLINDSGLPVEAFDAFLHEYGKSKDIYEAIHFARCEWDF